jgi:hypothetical protein
MDIGQIVIFICLMILFCSLLCVLYWYKFRPNYESYRNSILWKPFNKFWKIDTEEKWRLATSIATVVTILVFLLATIIALLGGFSN